MKRRREECGDTMRGSGNRREKEREEGKGRGKEWRKRTWERVTRIDKSEEIE